jgi:nicotinamidase-related amidase
MEMHNVNLSTHITLSEIDQRMSTQQLPLPQHYDPSMVGKVWKVSYEERAKDARAFAREHTIPPASKDAYKVCLIAIDVQNTFCTPGYELFVAGRSGTGAVDDTKRLCEFIYRNLHRISQISPTMDTHQAIQIFHSMFLVNADGEHPSPFTLVTEKDIRAGTWKFNPDVAENLNIHPDYGQRHLVHYAEELAKRGKYDLTIWPFHAMLGGVGHALVSSFEEAMFFHSVTRFSQPDIIMKGNNPFTEHYSAVGPEVLTDADGKHIASKNTSFIEKLKTFDVIIIAGEAKSHCVAWTIEDLITFIGTEDESLARKVYLLEDCTSPVVIPDVIDYTEQADEAFKHFSEAFQDAGVHIVKSTDPIDEWPGISS